MNPYFIDLERMIGGRILVNLSLVTRMKPSELGRGTTIHFSDEEAVDVRNTIEEILTAPMRDLGPR